jgi:hypothetical protein
VSFCRDSWLFVLFHFPHLLRAVTATELFKLVAGMAKRVLDGPQLMRAPKRIDSLMNALMHMYDPEGTLRCSGVNGDLPDAEVRTCVARKVCWIRCLDI